VRDDVSAAEVALLVRAALGAQPLLVRLPQAGAVTLAPIAAKAGAEALVIAAPPRAETLSGERTVAGRHYGPSTFPAALEALVAVAALGLGLPLVGAGGVYSAFQAREMLAAGAVAAA
jgi:dihydroorotate dehydrogenase